MSDKTVKCWLLTPDSNAIQAITMPRDEELKKIYDLLKCDHIEYQGFSYEDNHYGIYMDGYGALKHLPHNKCAKKLLGKIKKMQWGTLDGWYLIFKYDMNSETQYKLNMDITPKQFVDRFNYVIWQRQRLQLLRGGVKNT